MNLRYLHRRPARSAPCAPERRTGCTCVIAHALTPADKQMVLDAIALAEANGEADLIGYLEMRLNTAHCPAAHKES
jgi:hypothetical protein